MQRSNNRSPDELRPISFTRHFTQHAAGSVLVSFGNTKVICTASVEAGTPRFIVNPNQGWITAEYGMLPSATHDRCKREAARGKQTGRTIEIQRLIGRSLRAAVDLNSLGPNTITFDCDVIQADGGTRTAAITGCNVALEDAIAHMIEKGMLSSSPIKHRIAAVSVGIYQNIPVLDLDYNEDSQCETDMNIVMNEKGQFIEVQGTAEGNPFSAKEFQEILTLATTGIQQIIALQKNAKP